MNNLKEVDSHFAFGENWSEYAQKIDATRIEEAEKGLLRLLEAEEIQGKTFLDIGCGSGLHSLAALNLGAVSVLAIDIDEVSVTTTKKVLEQYKPNGQYEILQQSVFDLKNNINKKFDIVYSWGVLHHTGDMYQAITDAVTMVHPQGLFIVALYRKTPMCGVWKYIKRWYAHTSNRKQVRARAVYTSLLRFKYKLTGRDFSKMKDEYINSRGMSFEHDVHDWMGGYPYESVTPKELKSFMHNLGFHLLRSNTHPKGFGFFGTGCDEYVFDRIVNDHYLGSKTI
ncbi:MAG: class I SAM-dependent methyltransferase [Patescibacteria group bacterium]